MSVLSSWRLALRLAWRDALRSKGRSALVLVMIALPVLSVTAAAVVFATQDVDSEESLDRRLGSAVAKVDVQRGTGAVIQAPDPEVASSTMGRGGPPLTAAQISAALDGRRLVELRAGSVPVTTDRGEVYAEVTEVDLTDPMAEGLFVLSSGRLPRSADEVVVNSFVEGKGYSVGDRLVTRGAERPDPVIVGVAESTTIRDYAVLAGPLGSTGARTYGTTSYLVDGAPVTWAEVRALNAEGASVLSRAVVLDPPPLPPEVEMYADASSDDVVAIVVLVVVMALLELVLLAGPAFAVGARRQSRSLALLSASGGTPAQARRVVLGSSVVLGSAAAALGVALGIGAALGLEPILQARSGTWFGPFEVPWLYLLAIAGFGLLSAFLAAVVPAWIASRQDVVAVLAGRRGDAPPSVRSPVVGVLLLGGGVALAAYGASGSGDSSIVIAIAAVLSVLGMILLVPVVVVGVARLAGRLPLALRFAARDAARHRQRTVPAVAAVAATVAGVVALGIATASDEAQNREGYLPSLAEGAGALTSYARDTDWPALRAAVERELPGAEVVEVRGLSDRVAGGGYVETDVRAVSGDFLLDTYGNLLGSAWLVGEELPPGLPGVSEQQAKAADAVLAAGGVVAFTNQGVTGDAVRMKVTTRDERERVVGEPRRATFAAVILPSTGNGGAQAVLSPAAASSLGVEPQPVALVVPEEVSEAEEASVAEVVAGLSDQASLYVERGYETSDETVVIQLILGGLGAVLMLGGTLTATFLALADARPDLATLSAVGAAPRTRRGVAAAYAAVVGLVGAVLGAVVGFIPGIAITYPLTSDNFGPVPDRHYLDVPWLLVVGVVVVLPALTSLVVGLTARSRLPLVARLD